MQTEARPALPRPGQRRWGSQVLLLATLFATSTVSATVVVAAASTVGLQLSGQASLATLPVALALVGAMVATFPASLAMARWGRRVGFAAGTAIAVVGAGLAAFGIARSSFWVFCAGNLLLGMLGGVTPYYRFTAIEVSPPGRQARAIGYVLAGGVVAGVAGPPLGAWARDLVPQAAFAGSYLAMAGLGLVILLLLPLLRAPPPLPSEVGGGRPLAVILRDRRAVAAALAAVTAYAAMVGTMVAAPLSLGHEGHGIQGIALVIQAHVVAMFAPSFFSGSLVARLGPGRVMGAGITLFLAACATNLAGVTVAHHWVALVLLGVGWNFLFVAGTALLARTHDAREKGRVQGANDLAVATTGAIAALLAGPVHGWIGWRGLTIVVAASSWAPDLSWPPSCATGAMRPRMRPQPATRRRTPATPIPIRRPPQPGHPSAAPRPL